MDEERSYLAPAASADLAILSGLFRELDGRAEHFLAASGFAASEIRARYQLNLRYPGQNWSLPVEVADQTGDRSLEFLGEAVREGAIADFHERHRVEYGHSRLTEAPEITGVRLTASVEVAKPRFGSGRTATPSSPAAATTRRANLGRGFEETRIHRGAELQPGAVVDSPAIIEESFTTIVVYPGWRATLDDAGDYLLEWTG